MTVQLKPGEYLNDETEVVLFVAGAYVTLPMPPLFAINRLIEHDGVQYKCMPYRCKP